MTCETSTNFDLIPFIGWGLAVFGLFATLWGWNFRGRQQKFLASRKDIHDSIDKAIKSLIEFEDNSIAFWTNKETAQNQHSITVSHKRLVNCCMQIAKLKKSPMPDDLIYELRKSATFEFENSRRPISSKSIRVKRVSASATKLMNSEFLTKSWTSIDEPKILDFLKTNQS